MPELRPNQVRDQSVRNRFRKELDGGLITESEMKKIIRSVNDRDSISRTELEDLRRILNKSRKLSSRARKLLAEFVRKADRLAVGKGALRLLPMIHGKRFDSHLRRPARGSRVWDLTIEARVFMDPIDTPEICTDRGADRPCVAWPDGEFDKFKRAVRQRSRFWSDRFFLKPPTGLSSLDIPSGYGTSAVACKFSLVFVPRGVRKHRRIRAVYLDPKDKSEMRSHAKLYDNKDVRERTVTRGGREYKRVTVWHELGHLLGFGHIGITRKYDKCGPDDDTNESVCYGKNHRDRRDAMGIGTAITRVYADPWVAAAANHTFTDPGDWEVVINSVTRDKYTLD